MNPTTEQAVQQSVQGVPDAKQNGGLGAAFWGMEMFQRGPILPAWGTRLREWQLRRYDRHEFNTLWQGAKAGLVNRWCATPWMIDGGPTLTNRFQRLFRGAQFGEGWDGLIARVGADYLRFDAGAYIEVIAPGDPMKEPTGAVVGLAHLDSYHCLPTGDPQFPVLYYSRPTATKQATIHLLHASRVIHLIDMPDGDQDMPGYGYCALSRAIAVVQREIYMKRYVVTQLDDKPPPGMLLIGGMTEPAWNKAWASYRQDQSTDDQPDWGKVVRIFGADAALTPKVESVAFANPPDKFDFHVYVRIDVDELALAMGVDSQDLMPLASKAMGSGQQSQILHEKSKGKTYGHFLRLLERKLNDVLPEALTFEFKINDQEAALQNAEIATAWAGFASSIPPTVMSDKEKRQLLANQVEQVQKVITDERGQLIELTDADVQPVQQETLAQDATQNAPAPAPGDAQPVSAQDTTPNAPAQAAKDFEDTRASFVQDFTDLVQAGLADDVTRRRAGVVLRAQLNRYGKQAREDGLQQGGVEDGLSDDDLNEHVTWLAEQSGYVTGFLDEVFSGGLTNAQVGARAEAWANKSLQASYYGGLASADANGLYEFVGTDGKESCPQCTTLKGQAHRMKDWAAKQLRPGVDTESFDCGGYQCQHNLQKTSGLASGSWLS